MARVAYRILTALLLATCGIGRCGAESFADGDVVCFLGDSITKGGLYPSFVELFYVTRFPDRRIDFHNCGCGGDRAVAIIEAADYRLEEDVFARHPTHVVVMLGMNDVERKLYGAEAGVDAVAAARRTAIERYRENLDEICRRVISRGAKLILVTPSCYDEKAVIDAPNREPLLGVNGALAECATVVRQLAATHGAIVADAHGLMDRINRETQARDPTFSVTGAGQAWNDRVHPGPVGSFLIAYALLTAQGPFPPVATIAVDTAGTAGPERCIIDQCEAADGRLTFTCREDGLPCVLPEAATRALEAVPFAASCNRETLRVRGLDAGDHELLIDGRPIGVFTSADYQAGIDLADLPSTPQFRQAQQITAQQEIVRRAGESLREPATVRYVLAKRTMVEKNIAARVDWRAPSAYEAFIRAAVAKENDPSRPGHWLRVALEEVEHPGALTRTYAEAVAELRRLAQPVAHRYEIVRKASR
jgi:lysophospholipase L1-like esterase